MKAQWYWYFLTARKPFFECCETERRFSNMSTMQFSRQKFDLLIGTKVAKCLLLWCLAPLYDEGSHGALARRACKGPSRHDADLIRQSN